MKKLVYFVLCLFSLVLLSCGSDKTSKELSHKAGLILEQLQSFQEQSRNDVYKLYPTKNMWTFLELNTATGQIWIVQWSTETEKRFKYVLDDNERVNKDEAISGRFSLQSTENIYNFILLDNISGQCWQVQWSFEENERIVFPIY